MIPGGNSRFGVLGVCLDAHSYNALSHYINAAPGAAALGNLERYAGSEREVARLLEGAHNRLCVIDYDKNPEEALWMTERLRIDHPEIYIFAVSADALPDRIIAAMRAGCSEYLIKPLVNERVVDGLTHIETKQRERGRNKARRGKIITLIGAKGGTGVTTIALHLALHLANGRKKRCVLVDQHVAQGDASLYLGTGRHQYSFYELASNTDRLDEELLQGFLLKHDSGLDLIDSPEALFGAHTAPPAAVEHTLGFLAEVYNFVVVDCAPGLTDSTLACIAQSDQIGIVLTAELPAVRNTVRYLEHLTELGYHTDKVRVILNRHSKKGPLDDDRIVKAMKHGISHRIPNSYQEVIKAINAGVPITSDSRSDFGNAIDHWVKELDTAEKSKPIAAAASRNSGVLGLFGR